MVNQQQILALIDSDENCGKFLDGELVPRFKIKTDPKLYCFSEVLSQEVDIQDLILTWEDTFSDLLMKKKPITMDDILKMETELFESKANGP